MYRLACALAYLRRPEPAVKGSELALVPTCRVSSNGRCIIQFDPWRRAREVTTAARKSRIVDDYAGLTTWREVGKELLQRAGLTLTSTFFPCDTPVLNERGREINEEDPTARLWCYHRAGIYGYEYLIMVDGSELAVKRIILGRGEPRICEAIAATRLLRELHGHSGLRLHTNSAAVRLTLARSWVKPETAWQNAMCMEACKLARLNTVAKSAPPPVWWSSASELDDVWHVGLTVRNATAVLTSAANRYIDSSESDPPGGDHDTLVKLRRGVSLTPGTRATKRGDEVLYHRKVLGILGRVCDTRVPFVACQHPGWSLTHARRDCSRYTRSVGIFSWFKLNRDALVRQELAWKMQVDRRRSGRNSATETLGEE